MTFQLQWPTSSQRVIEHFLQNPAYWGSFTDSGSPLAGNNGISIEAAFQSEVRACADGYVKAVNQPGDVRPNGNHVTIQHITGDDDVYETTYCHLYEVHVRAGQEVRAGDVIALSDSTGSAIGAQLRLVVRKIGSASNEYRTEDGRTVRVVGDLVNPADYLTPAPETRFVKRVRRVSTFTHFVNVRTGPGTAYEVLYTAPPEDAVKVQGISPDKRWFHIVHNGQVAWSFARFIDFIGDVAALPTVKPPAPKITVKEPDFPLRGIHDGNPRYPDQDSGTDWLVKNDLHGWAVDMVYCMNEDNLDKTYPEGFNHFHDTDYTPFADAGIRVILRWNYSWAKSEHGNGTFGDPRNDDRLIGWIARGIKNTKGVWGHIIGNEPNRAGENHDYVGPGNIGTPIEPERIARLVKGVKQQVGKAHRISPPALDGTNTEAWQLTRDDRFLPNHFYRAILDQLDISDVDWIALHGYGRGSLDNPASDRRFGHPLEWQFYGFRMWEPFAAILREKGTAWESLPIVITETNHLKVGGRWNERNPNGWDNDQNGANWIRSAYEYIRQWNNLSSNQYVHGLVLYRLNQDDWIIENKPILLKALKQSGEAAL